MKPGETRTGVQLNSDLLRADRQDARLEHLYNRASQPSHQLSPFSLMLPIWISAMQRHELLCSFQPGAHRRIIDWHGTGDTTGVQPRPWYGRLLQQHGQR